MNCLECCDQVQEILDGRPPQADLEAHLAACKECRELHAVTRETMHGLTQMAPPAPAEDLADKIMRAVARDRLRQRGRRRLVTIAAAAAATIALLASLLPKNDVPTTRTELAKPAEERRPSLEDNVQQAGQALADLTLRTAVDTLQTSRAFLPTVDLPGASDSQLPLPEVAAESRQAWSDAIDGLSSGLEPLAASARQAASFFKREVPLLSQEPGSGM
jgi:anti-sigma factor RsiW